MNGEMTGVTALALQRRWEELTELASGVGHHLGMPGVDTPDSLVGECLRCDELFALDRREGFVSQFGDCTPRPSPGGLITWTR